MENKYGISRLFSSAARNSAQAPTVQCPKCQESYTLGVNGISTGCDQCEGVSRTIVGECCCFEVAGDNHKCLVHVKVSHV